MKQTIRALTLHRPWSYAIAYLGKDSENRSWKCPLPRDSYVAIHNGKVWNEDAAAFIRKILPKAYLPKEENDPKGAIIAVARYVGHFDPSESQSPWYMGGYGWKLQEVVAIAPVACGGSQGLWYPPPEVIDRVRSNYSEALKLCRS